MSKYPNLSKALLRHSKTYNDCLDFIKNPPADCQIVEICPPMRLKVKRDTINHNLLKEGYQIGVRSAEEFLRLNSNLFY
jgi:predicted patatin/cPLA2 family phospholipase